MRARWSLSLLASALLVVACSSGGGAPACSKSSDCGSGSECVYRIGDCAAFGQCMPVERPTCGAEEKLCGCGHDVITGCGYAEGYASGPTTGQTACP